MKLLSLIALFFMGVAVSACNTTRGVGEDVEATGEAIEDTAEDAMDDDRDYRP